MKTSLRAFGIGLFVAGASIALVDLSSGETESKQKDIALYEQQLKDYENQITLLTEQLDKQNSHKDEKSENQTAEKTNDSSSINEEKSNTEKVTEATIYIYEDVSIYTIGQQAEDFGIVANGRELELFLSKPDYARSIQKGAFDLSSDMTIEQIAKVLTGQSIE
ncbi:hypothetical protein H9635_10355 [Solibacillus sp. A46]|uniref:Endolytic transglycosylase MltG n=1 Tax=Solibacillus faecavium TaxID=2762221 RepID=A0ABR8XZ15_9BACL|nr:hypothetical protein [Solibacillus faecavium]MBD8037148.1 hypothetical protein [Solibacillus faecavium]